MVLNDVTLDYIIDYCQKHHEEAWLQSVALAPAPPDKNGRERRVSFIEIRKAFAVKFMPEIAPQHKPKKPTMYERIAAL